MSILPYLSKVPVNLKCCFLAKSCVLSFFGPGGLIVPRSIHSLAFHYDRSKMCKPAGLYSSLVFTRSKIGRKQKRPDPPTDFLPFPWTAKTKPFDEIANSGDGERTLIQDPALPKFGLDMIETLKDVDDDVRKQFSLESANKKELYEVSKEIILKKVQQHPVDFDSIEVTIALQTLRVRSLIHHYKGTPKEKRGKVALIHAIHRRNRNLNMLRKVDLPRFEWLIKELNVQYTPSPLEVTLIKYHRKNELRRLTKEYCDKLVSENRAAYHSMLKDQQKLFLKEKEEVLAWIAEEEKVLGIAKSDNESNA